MGLGKRLSYLYVRRNYSSNKFFCEGRLWQGLGGVEDAVMHGRAREWIKSGRRSKRGCTQIFGRYTLRSLLLVLQTKQLPTLQDMMIMTRRLTRKMMLIAVRFEKEV